MVDRAARLVHFKQSFFLFSLFYEYSDLACYTFHEALLLPVVISGSVRLVTLILIDDEVFLREILYRH